MKTYLYFILFLLLFVFPAFVTAQFIVSAELRPRFEVDNGAIKPHPDTLNTGFFVSQRTRLTFDYKQEKFQVRLTAQDVRYWGSGDIYSASGVFGSSRGLDIHEAWFRLKLCEYSDLTIGRQVLKFDDQRLIATRNWNQFGISYDAIRYNFLKNDWDLNVVVSYNNNYSASNGKLVEFNGLYDNTNLMRTFNFVHLNHKFSEGFQASAMTIVAGYQSPVYKSVNYLMGTYGIWLKFSKGIFDISADAYFQNGKAQSGKEVMAFMATVHPGVKVGKVRIGLGGDYFSGDNAENDDYDQKERTFNHMYGAVFKYYGYMNYFSFMRVSTAKGGLIDLYPNVILPLADKHSITALFHKFYLANPIMLEGEVNDDRDLGAEIDLMYTWKPMKELMVQAGFSYYFTTPTLEKMRGVYPQEVEGVKGPEINAPYWTWVMLTFTPQLFSAN